jgi:hypothetical protein
MKKGWYQEQVEAAKREIEQWPDWMRRGVEEDFRRIILDREHEQYPADRHPVN